MYIKKQIFISRGFRPLYIFAIRKLPKLRPRNAPEYKDNRERMFIEREEMEMHDTDAPYIPDTRTDLARWSKKIEVLEVEEEEVDVSNNDASVAPESFERELNPVPAKSRAWGIF